MIPEAWPKSAWYALIPPLAIVVFCRFLPASFLGIWAQWLLVGLSQLLNLWFKGATAAFYLRRHEVGQDGAAHAVG